VDLQNLGCELLGPTGGSYSNITRPIAVKRGGEEAKVKEMVGTMEGEEGEGVREEKNVKR